MLTLTTEPMYTIQDVPGKGKGLIATRDIPMGTRILSEEPIVRVPENAPDSPTLREFIRLQVDALTPDQREAFLSMHNIHADDSDSKYLGIIGTNALPFGQDKAGIFLDACRINHACDNNAQKCWNENIMRHTVHALRNIEKGEEITIYYLGVINNREARQEALQRKFAFTCACRLCSLPPDQSRESDKMLDEVLVLDHLIGRDGLMGISAGSSQKLRHVDRQITLYNEHRPNDAGLPKAFLDAVKITVVNGDLARAGIFAQKAMLGWAVLGGDDCPNVLENEALSKDPSKHGLYGRSMQWKTAVDDVPSGLDPTQFDNWLWRREKSKRPGQVADFRNQTTFPHVYGLPDDKYITTEFYSSSDATTHRPRRHWLLLAEIIDIYTETRLQVDIQDITGVSIPLIFHADGRGSEFVPSEVDTGCTVAILYANRRGFMHSDPAICLKDSSNMKIFPMMLRDILALSDRVQKYSVKRNGLRTCHGCGKQAASLKKCTKCSLFWYCDATCQIKGWNEKDHNIDCKDLRDGDLKGLFFFDWDKFEGCVKFPLNPTTP